MVAASLAHTSRPSSRFPSDALVVLVVVGVPPFRLFSHRRDLSDAALFVFFLSSRRLHTSFLYIWCIYGREGAGYPGSSRSIPPTLIKPSTLLETSSPKTNSALFRFSGWSGSAVVREDYRECCVRAKHASAQTETLCPRL